MKIALPIEVRKEDQVNRIAVAIKDIAFFGEEPTLKEALDDIESAVIDFFISKKWAEYKDVKVVCHDESYFMEIPLTENTIPFLTVQMESTRKVENKNILNISEMASILKNSGRESVLYLS